MNSCRWRIGLPESVEFHDDAETAKNRDWFNEHLEVMNSIMMMDSLVLPQKKTCDAVPRISDDRVAHIVSGAMRQATH